MAWLVSKGPPKNYFVLQKRLFKLVGLSFGEEGPMYKFYSRVILLGTICTYPLVQGSHVFLCFGNLSLLSVVLLYTSIVLSGSIKSISMFLNKESLRKTLDKLESGIFLPRSEEEESWIKKAIYVVTIQTLSYLGAIYLSTSTGVLDAVMKRIESDDPRDWRFPQGYFALFDVSRSPNYEVALFYQVFSVGVCVTFSATVDLLSVCFLVHITTQLKMLQHRVKEMIPSGSKGEDVPWERLETVLNENVFYHMQIIQFCEGFESQFHPLLFVQFCSSTISLCFTLYYATLFPVSDPKFHHFVIVLMVLLMQILLVCYWGNEVALQSLAVADACSEVDIVGTDVRFQKGLLLMITRSQRPIVLTAGKFTRLSLNTFVAITRASYSYYTVMSTR